MHPITFQVKQVHLAMIALGRRVFANAGIEHMTPARFDFLHAIQHDGGWIRLQQDVRRDLGLSNATVSTMVKRLEELGLLYTKPEPSDRRLRLLTISPAGLALYNRAREVLCEGRVIAETVVESIAPDVVDVPTLIIRTYGWFSGILHKFRQTWHRLGRPQQREEPEVAVAADAEHDPMLPDEMRSRPPPRPRRDYWRWPTSFLYDCDFADTYHIVDPFI